MAHPTIPDHLQPRFDGKNETERGRLFNNKLLEKLTRTSLEVPVIMHTIIATTVLYLGYSKIGLTTLQLTGLFAAGVLMWTFTEYWVHRGVYHCQTNWNWLKNVQHMGHGIHHQYPRDAKRLAMPPLPAIILVSLIFGIFWLIMGNYAFGFFPGFLIGYMLYITLHYAQHRYKAPKFKPLQTLWKFHALHHYKYPDKAFGVSTRLWDYIFRTIPE
ncbi:sterol desaturase family protein [Flexithrix dorotheae]|uniref:sterol desaturase family protein n=1 Tax=Flexithrix dorotheae TaxID=70993 RepID=UPI000382BAAE|nr:sterol desaturase family protein [Flexithrix dorotheae]